MPPDVAFERVAPVVPVRDLDAALARYRRLGFDVDLDVGPERYSFVERGQVSIHLIERHEHDPGQASTVVYLYVSDADALHAEWSQAGADGELTDPFDTAYGLREFGYRDPEGTFHRIGSPLTRAHPRQSQT
jgi:hypothetical protein